VISEQAKETLKNARKWHERKYEKARVLVVSAGQERAKTYLLILKSSILKKFKIFFY